jgi:predicted Zn-dependent protease
MGQLATPLAEQSIGLVNNERLQTYVQRLGATLAARPERPNLPWRFRVLDDPTPNAFALPGGFIYVTRGLLSLMDSESELASVIGHEIGHVTARHSVTAISRAQLAQLGLGAGMILAPELQQFGQVASSGLGLLFLKHGRDAERQADDLGFRYAQNQGYDVREMADVFASLQAVGESERQGRVPSWLATHPYPEERIQRVQQRLATLGPAANTGRLGDAEYLNQINGLMYGENPRAGIFRGSTFLHPDLNFRIDSAGTLMKRVVQARRTMP